MIQSSKEMADLEVQVCNMTDTEYDGYLAGFEEVIERARPVCPECSTYMRLQSETYTLTSKYIDEWYECPKCGYCISK